MNCLEFRRELTADPTASSVNLRAHLRECRSCTEFAGRQQEFEQALRAAAQVPVPEGLVSRILLRQSLEEDGQSAGRPKMFQWAAAASLLMGVGLGVILWLGGTAGPDLAQAMVAHIESDAHANAEARVVQLGELNDVLRPFQAQVRGDIGTVRQATACPIRNKWGAHVVMSGPQGTVTVMVLPGQHVKGRQTLREGRYQGVIIPTSNGSLAFLAENLQAINAAEERVLGAIRFLN